jgi:hypothetical protein
MCLKHNSSRRFNLTKQDESRVLVSLIRGFDGGTGQFPLSMPSKDPIGIRSLLVFPFVSAKMGSNSPTSSLRSSITSFVWDVLDQLLSHGFESLARACKHEGSAELAIHECRLPCECRPLGASDSERGSDGASADDGHWPSFDDPIPHRVWETSPSIDAAEVVDVISTDTFSSQAQCAH